MNITKALLLCAATWASYVSASGQEQKGAQEHKPLLVLTVESEKDNLTMPTGVTVASRAEVDKVRDDLIKQLGSMFEIIQPTDKRDCVELGVVIEKLSTSRGTFYVGSTVIAMGRGENDLLVTHNPVVEPTLVKFESAITFQLSSMVIQASLGK